MTSETQAKAIEPAIGETHVTEIADLKEIVGHLHTLIDFHIKRTTTIDPPPAPAPCDTPAPEGADTVFKYGLLSALMGDRSLNGLTVAVQRENGGLKVVRPSGCPDRGNYLSFTATRHDPDTYTNEVEPFTFSLSNDKIAAKILKDNYIDVSKPFNAFVLRDGQGGPLKAVAPPLAAS
jgi:hypothetical protein